MDRRRRARLRDVGRRGRAAEPLRPQGLPGNENATVFADGKVATVLFRVRNTTGSDIGWNAYWSYTCYAGWNERARWP
jgi:hypothetical protein